MVKVPRLVPFSETGAWREPHETASGRGSTQRLVAWVVGATGLALGIGAGVFSVLAAGRNSDSKANCDPDQPNRCGPSGVSQMSLPIGKGLIWSDREAGVSTGIITTMDGAEIL